MKFLAGLFALLISSTSAFYSASIDVSNRTVGISANYTFTLALTSNYNSIPAGFRIEIIFPSTVILQGSINSLPTYCTVLDVTEIVIKTLYDSSNPSAGQTDSDYDGQCGITGSNTVTLVNPKLTEVQINFKIGLLSNPNISYTSPNMGNMQFYGFLPGSTKSDYYISIPFPNKYFLASSLPSVQIAQDNLNVAGWSTYTITIITGKEIPSSGLLAIVFKTDTVLKSQAETSATGTVNNKNSQVLGVNINSQTVTLTGLFSNLAPSGSSIQITIGQIKNPKFVGSSIATINTYTSNTEAIESGTFSIISSNPCQITFNNYIASPSTVLSNANDAIYFGTDIYDASDSNQFQFYLKILFPTTFTIQSSSGCSTAGGITNSQGLVCSVSNNEIKSTIVSQSGTLAGFRFVNIINPPNNKTTDYIRLYLYTPSDVLICQNEKLVNFTASPNSIVLNSKKRNSSVVADPGPYVLSFTTTTQIPSGAIIKVVIPSDQVVENTEIQCFQELSSANICSKGQNPVDPKTVELIMNEWCSVSDAKCSSCCVAGTNLQITITGVRNPMFINTTVTSQIRIYTYNADMTGVIDMLTTGGQFQPTLTYRSVSGSISRSGDTVQLDAILSFSFTSLTDYISSSTLQLSLPTSLIFISTSLSCSILGSPVQCSSTLNSDNSVKTLTFSLCSSLCSANTYFSIKIIGLKNPLTTKSVTGSFTFSVLFSGYLIESGVLGSSLGSFQPNVISKFGVSRSSNVVSAYTTVNLMMQISSKVPAGGEIELKLPENLLITDSVVKVFDGNRQLQYSGNFTDMRIIDYCDSNCLPGSTINLTFVGTKNPDSVITISGIISVTTRYTGTIDIGSVDISTILSPLNPGKIFNPEIHPLDPTVSVTTDYRIIFTPEHSIPAGAYVEIAFPNGPQFSTPTCDTYLNIESLLSCSKSSNTLFVRNGFSKPLKGSFMIGIILESVINPGSPISFSGFKITLKDSSGFVIDTSSTFSVTYYSPAVSCECSKCSGTLCYECIIPGNYPFLTDYTCTQTCSSGRFLTNTQPYTCLKCHYTCATCDSYLSSSCLTCETGFYKSDGFCVPSCPKGTTLIGNECTSVLSCTSPCATCSASPDYCFSCISSFKYTPGTGECTSQCPNGYYWDGSICIRCKYNCGTCKNIQTCNSCLSYYPEQLLDEGVCVSQCPTGISITKGNSCIPCDTTCTTCSDIGPSDCITCTGDRYLYQETCSLICPNNFYRSIGNLCIQSCPEGYYVTDDSLDCLACDSTCGTCSDSDKCTSCKGNLYLYGNSCASSCPTDYLKNSENLCIPGKDCGSGFFINSDFCYSCPDECSECSSNATCSVCSAGFFLYQHFCYSVCPAGYLKREGICIKNEECTKSRFIDQDTCSDCDESCATCSGYTESTCTSCVNELYLYLQTCVLTCPEGYNKYPNNTCLSICPQTTYSDSGSCESCSSGCTVCKNNTYCDKCSGELFLTIDNQCVENCPEGYYGELGACYLICDDTDCITCDHSDNKKCLKCATGTYLYNGLCVNYCPDGYYEAVNECKTCQTGCANCEQSNHCEKCEKGFALFEGNCFDSCPVQYFEFNQICESCDKNCSVCSGFDKCQQCDDSTVLFKDKCVKTCPKKFKEIDDSCVFQCPGNCSECLDEKCVKCESGVLFNGECEATCPETFYAASNICKKCPKSCKFCESSALCSECQINNYLYKGTCYSKCPENTKLEKNEACTLVCPDKCKACTESACIECESSYGFYQDTCQACPTGTFLVSGFCEDCSANCSNCTSLDACQSCLAGYLLNGVCLDECPSGYFGEQGECKKSVLETDAESSEAAYLVYPLIFEFFIILTILLAARFIYSDSYLIVPSGLALFSFLIFNCKVFLLGALWATGNEVAGILVPLLTAFVVGTGSLGVIFVYMHVEPLSYQSSTIEYYKNVHTKAFLVINFLSVVLGCQFFRIIYSGIFGFAATTESKTLAYSNRFRHPLEKMCQFNCFIVSLPLVILCAVCLGIFNFTSDVWQVALFTASSTLLIEGYYIFNYYRSYVFMN